MNHECPDCERYRKEIKMWQNDYLAMLKMYSDLKKSSESLATWAERFLGEMSKKAGEEMTDFTEAAREAAIRYVKETDYVTDLNRNLAGNAFLAGAEFGRKRMVEAILKELRGEGVHSETLAISGNAWADWLEARIQEIEGKK